jgi:hypothetical protein
MVIARRFSITNFAIATSALCFQVFVLYPWHQKLDEGFERLKQDQLRMMSENEHTSVGELRAIKDLLSALQESKIPIRSLEEK